MSALRLPLVIAIKVPAEARKRLDNLDRKYTFQLGELAVSGNVMFAKFSDYRDIAGKAEV